MPAAKANTTAQGLGWRHRQAREVLMRRHVDGKACDWCGRPLYKDRTKNWDFNPASTNPDSGKLHADHSTVTRSQAVRQGVPIPRADRLLHGACNIQRGDGGNDHLAATSAKAGVDTTQLAMAWPW